VFRRRVDTEQWQPRLWAVLVGLTLLALYVIAFIVKNDDQIDIVSLIWVIVFLLALGVLGGVLLSQLSRWRRRRAKRAGQPGGSVG
jgi:uncharacterized integral membrane protein